jgi:hypothetical protein
MATDDSADEICRRMAELRRDLAGGVREVGRSARVMTDWTFYVRRFPWAMVGIAAAAGFVLIPRKKQIISPDQTALAEMVKKKQLRLDVDHKKEKRGMLPSLLMMGLTWALKAGTAYMGERMRVAAANKAQLTPERPPAPSPLEQPWTH